MGGITWNLTIAFGIDEFVVTEALSLVQTLVLELSQAAPAAAKALEREH